MRAVVAILLALVLTAAAPRSERTPTPTSTPAVLVFTHSTGFRHDSIEPAAAALAALGRERGFVTVASADPAIFADAALARFAAVVLVSTTTRPDDPASEWFVGERRAAFQRFVRRGAGVVGIHAAADSHYGWPWYGAMIGARFLRHPPGTPEGEVTLVDRRHPAARGLRSPKRRVDEWYAYRDRRGDLAVVATFDPRSIGEAGTPAPIAWAHRFEGGRVFYTGMGHTAASFAEPWFLSHLAGGIAWALGRDARRGDGASRRR